MTKTPWPAPLNDGETLIAQGRPSAKRRAIETLWVGMIAGILNAAIELYQNSFRWDDFLIFLGVFAVVYTLFNIFFRKGDDWMLTDRRLLFRRGSILAAEDVAGVFPKGSGLIIRSTRDNKWLVEPLDDPSAIAARLNWGTP